MAQTSTKRQLTDEGKMPAKGSLWVNNKYTLIHQLYEGVSSKIFVGAFMKNNRQVTRAIKVQPIQHSNNRNQFSNKNVNTGLKNQISVLRHLFTNEYSKLDIKIGFPHLFEFGSEHQFNYLVMTMYGPNLIQLMRLCGGKFSARTTLLIALQIIDRLEDIHQKKYLYGGICPENFMVGTGKESYLLYMTDFGKSTIYKSKNKGTHIPYQTTNTYEHSSYDHVFMSVNCQLGVQSSRRDDIQSFMYLILYLFKGRLPWTFGDYGTYSMANNSNLNSQEQEGLEPKKEPISSALNVMGNNNAVLQEQRSKILEIKRRISPESLFKSMSFELIDLMHYVKTLSFYQKPDYQYIRKKLWGALMETDYEELKNNVIIYDWNQRQPLDYEIYRDCPKFKLKSEKDKYNDEIVQQISVSERMSGEGGNQPFIERKASTKSANSNKKMQTSSSSSAANKTGENKNQQKSNVKFRCSLQQKSPDQEKEKENAKDERKFESEDDANVVDEEEQGKGHSDPNTNRIDKKLKIVNQIDQEQMNASLFKENRNIKNVTTGQSRFKQVNQ